VRLGSVLVCLGGLGQAKGVLAVGVPGLTGEAAAERRERELRGQFPQGRGLRGHPLGDPGDGIPVLPRGGGRRLGGRGQLRDDQAAPRHPPSIRLRAGAVVQDQRGWACATSSGFHACPSWGTVALLSCPRGPGRPAGTGPGVATGAGSAGVVSSVPACTYALTSAGSCPTAPDGSAGRACAPDRSGRVAARSRSARLTLPPGCGEAEAGVRTPCCTSATISSAVLMSTTAVNIRTTLATPARPRRSLLGRRKLAAVRTRFTEAPLAEHDSPGAARSRRRGAQPEGSGAATRAEERPSVRSRAYNGGQHRYPRSRICHERITLVLQRQEHGCASP